METPGSALETSAVSGWFPMSLHDHVTVKLFSIFTLHMSAGMLKACLCPTTAATQMPADSREGRSRSHRESVQEDPRATGGDRRPPEPERPPRGTAGLTPCPKAPAYPPSCTAPAMRNASFQILFKCPTPAIVSEAATKP